MRKLYGKPYNVFHVALDRSVCESDGPATAKVVEFVQNYFPASRVTPEFQKQVAGDLSRFDEIYAKGVVGHTTWELGWVLEEQEHKDIQGEKANCCIVIRGWDKMDSFEQSVESDAFQKAIPLLLAWNAPFDMVGVRITV